MKTQLFSAATMAALILASCGPSAEEIAAAAEKATADSLAAIAAMEKSFTIDPATSVVNWSGTMLGVKTHTGSLAVAGGNLTVKGGAVTGGDFTVDMRIDPATLTDANYAPDGSKQGTKDMLIGHLMSADFFDAANYPTATFKITGVNGNTATGDLTVRGKTNSESITDINVSMDGDVMKASGNLTFNRQKYGVAWSTGAKEMVLSDDITLNVVLVGNAN